METFDQREMRRLAVAHQFPGETAAEPQRTPIWLATVLIVIVPVAAVVVASALGWH